MRSQQRTNPRINRGQAAGLEQLGLINNGRNTRPRIGAYAESGQEAPDWSIRGKERRQEGGPQDWSIGGNKRTSPGLQHPRLHKKEEPTRCQPQEQLGTSSWARAAGAHEQRMEAHKPQYWSIRGKMARSLGLEQPGQSKAARRRPPGLEHPRDRGPTPPTGTSGAEQGGKKAGPETGQSRRRKRRAPWIGQSLGPPSCRLALPRRFQSGASVRGPLDVQVRGAAFLPPCSVPVAPALGFLPFFPVCSNTGACVPPSVVHVLQPHEPRNSSPAVPGVDTLLAPPSCAASDVAVQGWSSCSPRCSSPGGRLLAAFLCPGCSSPVLLARSPRMLQSWALCSCHC